MSTNIAKPSPAKTSRVWIPALALSVLLILITLVSRLVTQNRSAAVAPPLGFQLAAEIDLAGRAHEEAVITQLTLTETADVNIYLALQNINTPYFDLSLRTSEGNSLNILHSETFRTDQAGSSEWAQILPPGTYQLVLTAEQSTGHLSIYWDQPQLVD
ncbi:MAG: hypothetical protein KDE51_21630 [Anaerolineales bacterium]|nr:hypothetical protein [Anaerolineales bacterium]